MPRSAILVLNWNGLDNTRECVEACPPHVPRYVLNNGCRPDQRYSPSDARAIVFETSNNVGFAAGMNVLIGSALRDGAEWLLLLNNDARLEKDALANMLERAEGDVAAITPALIDPGSGRVWSLGGRLDLWLGRTTSEFHGAEAVSLPSASMEVDFGSGACLLVSGLALEHVGGLDETYFAYWEETDWCLRARRMGYRVVTAPTATVTHAGGASSSGSRRVHLLVRNVILFMRRHAARRHWLTFVPVLVLWSIPAWSARALTRQPLAVMLGILAAVTWQFRPLPRPVIDYVTAAERHAAIRHPPTAGDR